MKQQAVDQAISDGFLSIAPMLGETECDYYFSTKSGLVMGLFRDITLAEIPYGWQSDFHIDTSKITPNEICHTQITI